MEETEPIEPEAWRRSLRDADAVFLEIRQASFLLRVGAGLIFGFFGLLVVTAGLGVLSVEHWAATLAAFLIVEPLAILMLLMALYCVLPATTIGRFAQRALTRAWPMVYVVIGTVAVGTIALSVFLLWMLLASLWNG